MPIINSEKTNCHITGLRDIHLQKNLETANDRDTEVIFGGYLVKVSCEFMEWPHLRSGEGHVEVRARTGREARGRRQ